MVKLIPFMFRLGQQVAAGLYILQVLNSRALSLYFMRRPGVFGTFIQGLYPNPSNLSRQPLQNSGMLLLEWPSHTYIHILVLYGYTKYQRSSMVTMDNTRNLIG